MTEGVQVSEGCALGHVRRSPLKERTSCCHFHALCVGRVKILDGHFRYEISISMCHLDPLTRWSKKLGHLEWSAKKTRQLLPTAMPLATPGRCFLTEAYSHSNETLTADSTRSYGLQFQEARRKEIPVYGHRENGSFENGSFWGAEQKGTTCPIISLVLQVHF